MKHAPCSRFRSPGDNGGAPSNYVMRLNRRRQVGMHCPAVGLIMGVSLWLSCAGAQTSLLAGCSGMGGTGLTESAGPGSSPGRVHVDYSAPRGR